MHGELTASRPEDQKFSSKTERRADRTISVFVLLCPLASAFVRDISLPEISLGGTAVFASDQERRKNLMRNAQVQEYKYFYAVEGRLQKQTSIPAASKSRIALSCKAK